MIMSVNFAVKADFKDVNKMLNNYGTKAVKEYKRALTNTSVYGLREIKTATPSKTNVTSKGWKWSFTGGLITSIINNMSHVPGLNNGWKRTTPIVAKNAKALVFEVGKKTAAKSSTFTLYKRYKAASQSMKGKGLSGKKRSDAITAKSGVVVVRRVNTPASFAGRHFIEPTVKKIEKKFMAEILKANERILA